MGGFLWHNLSLKTLTEKSIPDREVQRTEKTFAGPVSASTANSEHAALSPSEIGANPVHNWAEWPMPNSQTDVTAGAPNLGGYVDNSDGTVTDNVTGLMWQQLVPNATHSWDDAIAYCTALSLAGHNDWRLPSRIELVSIVDTGQSSPSIDDTHFPSTPAADFWSSSPVVSVYRPAGSPRKAWVVDFFQGSTVGYHVVSATNNVRCVRSGRAG
jgi:hypothetical protein